MIMTEEEFERTFGKKAPKRRKYGNKTCEWRGIKFPSRHEMERFIILYYEEQDGVITDLNRQVRFQLLPAQKDENGKVIERPCFYIADFVYKRDGKLVVEDAKGFRPKEYLLKRKMMLWFHGIRIEEV